MPDLRLDQADTDNLIISWWRIQMETFSALLALCEGNASVTGGFPSQRPVTWSFDIFFDLRLNKWFSKQLRCRWFETLSRPSLRHCNVGSLFVLGYALSAPQPDFEWLARCSNNQTNQWNLTRNSNTSFFGKCVKMLCTKWIILFRPQ